MDTQNKNWKITNEPTPRSSVQLLCIDGQNKILSIHRSDKVRSVKNTWSFPSGLHDIGETMEQCAARELKEEFNIDTLAKHYHRLGVYENIDGDPEATQPWHWVLNVFAVRCEFTDLVNREPDKHDAIELVDLSVFAADIQAKNYHVSFKNWIQRRYTTVWGTLRAIALSGSPAL